MGSEDAADPRRNRRELGVVRRRYFPVRHDGQRRLVPGERRHGSPARGRIRFAGRGGRVRRPNAGILETLDSRGDVVGVCGRGAEMTALVEEHHVTPPRHGAASGHPHNVGENRALALVVAGVVRRRSDPLMRLQSRERCDRTRRRSHGFRLREPCPQPSTAAHAIGVDFASTSTKVNSSVRSLTMLCRAPASRL